MKLFIITSSLNWWFKPHIGDTSCQIIKYPGYEFANTRNGVKLLFTVKDKYQNVEGLGVDGRDKYLKW